MTQLDMMPMRVPPYRVRPSFAWGGLAAGAALGTGAALYGATLDDADRKKITLGLIGGGGAAIAGGSVAVEVGPRLVRRFAVDGSEGISMLAKLVPRAHYGQALTTFGMGTLIAGMGAFLLGPQPDQH